MQPNITVMFEEFTGLAVFEEFAVLNDCLNLTPLNLVFPNVHYKVTCKYSEINQYIYFDVIAYTMM